LLGPGQRDLGKEVAQISIPLQSVGFGGLDEAVEGRARRGALGVACEEPVLPSDDERLDRVFREVVVRGEHGVIYVDGEPLPLPQGVGDRLAEESLRGHVALSLIEPRLEGVQDRLGFFSSLGDERPSRQPSLLSSVLDCAA
jgi:hypothetical protein